MNTVQKLKNFQILRFTLEKILGGIDAKKQQAQRHQVRQETATN